MRKDYIAQWYEVREQQGVSDRIHCCSASARPPRPPAGNITVIAILTVLAC